jgi:peptidoglycan/LPS O-acetylase OafA/YrhL
LKIISSIQQLRGLAAMGVVLLHARLMAAGLAPRGDTEATAQSLPLLGAGGVDLFFVISGFVMAEILSRIPPRLPGDAVARRFLLRRIGRVFPLYWIATFAMVAAIAALPVAIRESRIEPLHLAASLVLVPSPNWNGEWLPLVVVGWTLTFEMLFYLAIAAALAMKLRCPVGWASALLAAGAILGAFHRWPMPFAVLTDPLLLEFGFGVAAWWASRRWALSRPWLYSLIGLCFAILVTTASEAWLPWRALCWGLPSALLVFALVSHERSQASLQHSPRARFSGWLLQVAKQLGDASYSIYLFHPFAIKIIARATAYHGVTAGPVVTPALVIAATLICAGLGLIVYHLIEKPLLAATYRLLADRRSQ